MKSPPWCADENGLDLRKRNLMLLSGLLPCQRRFSSLKEALAVYEGQYTFTNAKRREVFNMSEPEQKVIDAYAKICEEKEEEGKISAIEWELLENMKDAYGKGRLLFDSYFQSANFSANRKEKLSHTVAALALGVIISVDSFTLPVEFRRVVDATANEEGKFRLLPEMAYKTDGNSFRSLYK